MARLAHAARVSYFVKLSARPAAVVLVVASAAAMIAASAVERGNVPYTLNLVRPADQVVGVVLFSVPVLGFVVLALRPGHRSGWLCWAPASLSRCTRCPTPWRCGCL